LLLVISCPVNHIVSGCIGIVQTINSQQSTANSQQSTVNSQHHSGATGIDITYYKRLLVISQSQRSVANHLGDSSLLSE